ncbi:ABC transporter substrate-binding protein [Geodermatophilus ruber]|uniref:Amino acid/amide ABC transporter substrate-binding protein, HAAT family n=1 Tax=Geodermatophilus ruber TaxID=504800 RepID=A0A1I4I5S5_9ACTN|nr:ABC transporter substrate-binding protein [Geodermatophilus ruber]SFL49615.1 amino acid/amide ABC transporter substrate-binding protein, HAAT family [Geodermatophilus ruber]
MRGKSVGVAGAVLLLTACGGTVAGGGGGGGGGSDEPVRIGVITGLTGAYVQLGEEQRNGAELAVEQLGGQIGDRPIELIVRDDQLKPDVALREAQALVQEEQVDYLTGCVSAATTLAVNQIATQAGVPYIGTCQTEQLNRPPNYDADLTYHLAPTPSQAINAGSPFICDQLGRSVFLLMPDYAFGHEQEAAYKQAIPEQAGCTVVGTAYFPLGTTDFNPYIPTIEGSGAEVLVFGGAGRDQVSFLRQVDQFGLTDRFRTFLSIEDLSFDQELGFDLIDGTWAMAAFYWNVEDEGVQEYVDAYREAYGAPPGGYGVYLWNAINLIAASIEDGAETPEEFREFMEGKEVSLAQGEMTIRACDHQALAPIVILEGLAADEAESRGGDGQWGYREVVETLPGSEDYAPTCEEVQTEFQRAG